MENPFILNGYLDGRASFNRIPIINSNEIAADILNKIALVKLIRSNLVIDKHLSDDELIFNMDSLLDDKDEDALSIVELYALNFVKLIKSIQSTNNSRPDWDFEDFEFVRNIKTIYLGGGLMNGLMGQYFYELIIQLLNLENIDLKIKRLPYPSISPLVGISQYASRSKNSGILFDFGHSFIKRGFFIIEKGEIVLTTLPEIPVPNEDLIINGEMLHLFMVDAFNQTFEMLKEEAIDTSHIICSIANYVGEDCFYNRGVYALLNEVSHKYSDYLCEIYDQKYNFQFIHDGTASSLGCDEEETALVLTLGSAIGVGYTDGHNSLKRLKVKER